MTVVRTVSEPDVDLSNKNFESIASKSLTLFGAQSFLKLVKQIIKLRNIPVILPAVFWFIVTTVLLCLPGSAFPKENWFEKIWLDKWVHIGLFALLAFLWCGATTNGRPKRVAPPIQIAFYCLLYGIVMEFIQKYFIPNRSFDPGDIIADGIGSALGAFVATRWYIKK